MSGFVALLALDGGHVEAARAAVLTALHATHAPDGHATWASGPVALGQAVLRTDDARPAPDVAPASRAERLWIVADGRVDDQASLRDRLRDAGSPVAVDADSRALILAAYEAWGERLGEHLLGDFAFALWDARARRLTCARDHFGVRPLYYAVAAHEGRRTMVVADTVDAVRAHPGVADDLSEAALLDLLVFAGIPQLDMTVFAGIRSLPPAHLLSIGIGETVPPPRRYWQLPVEEPLSLRRPRDYADHLEAHLLDAVRDRVPDGRLAIALSGGRDSPAIAWAAKQVLDERHADPARFRAFTADYQPLLPDDRERHYAGLVAAALGIESTVVPMSHYRMFERWTSRELRRAEPVLDPLLVTTDDFQRAAARFAPVELDGVGGDPAQHESESRLATLLAAKRFGTAAREAFQYVWLQRRLPRPGMRTLWRLQRGESPYAVSIPAWIDPAVAARHDLAARVAASTAEPDPRHPTRPVAHRQLAAWIWPRYFEASHGGARGMPLEVRYPFFDLRVVRFLLRVPPVAWTNDKGVLQLMMRGRLPRALLQRPKTPLEGDPYLARLWRDGEGWLGDAALVPEVAALVRAEAMPRIVGGQGDGSVSTLWADLAPISLSMWIRHHRSVPPEQGAGATTW